MAEAGRETDPIMPSQPPRPRACNGELREVACELMQAVSATTPDLPPAASAAPPPKPTLLELAQRSRARNERLSLQQLVSATLSDHRWRRNAFASAYRRRQERLDAEAAAAASVPPPPAPVWTPQAPVEREDSVSETSAVDEDSETAMLRPWRKGVDGPCDDAETEDELGADPRTRLISAV